MKLLIATLFIMSLFCGGTSFAQSTFQMRIQDLNTDEVINSAIETDDGGFILVCQQNQTDSLYKYVDLVKLSPSGLISKSHVFDCEGNSSGLIYISKSDPNKFLLTGYSETINGDEIWLCEIDSSLNILSNKLFNVGPNFHSIGIDKDENNNYIINGILFGTMAISKLFLYKISATLDSISMKIISEEASSFQPSLLRKKDFTGYYLFCPFYDVMSSQTVLTIDNEFNLINTTPIDFYSENPNSAWINDHIYFSSNYHNLERKVGVCTMDSDFIIYKEKQIGSQDTVEWSGLRKSMSYIDSNIIFIGTIHNFDGQEYSLNKTWICLSNFDSLTNLRWQKFYGGNANMPIWGLIATSDGGCLLYGTTHDSVNGPYERDVLVIKVNEDGLVNVESHDQISVHDLIVFPNPGKNELNIVSGPQISGSTFELMSITGAKILSRTLRNSTKVNTNYLQTGTYLWDVKFDGKIIETGKWVKE